MILGWKRITNQGEHFLSCGFLWGYAGPKSNFHPRTEVSSMASLTPNGPFPKKTCALIFKKQIFSFNVCVMSSTSVQSVFCKYINHIEVHVFWISIQFFLWLQCNWNKQGGISRFKNDVKSLISSKCPSSFTFLG